ncbi:hypothetical protein [Legionella antarctica]|nr:hypothetical protein [Legionella antarctica]
MKNVEFKDGQSLDIVKENIEKLKELFPEAFSEAGVNFNTLRQLIGDVSILEEGNEKYGFELARKKESAPDRTNAFYRYIAPMPR